MSDVHGCPEFCTISEQTRNRSEPLLHDFFNGDSSTHQQIPKSDSTKAPLSKTRSRVSGSRTTDAVKPTAEEPFPDV